MAVGFRSNRFVPPGHFYSPMPSPADVERALTTKRPPGPEVDLRVDAQLANLRELGPRAPGFDAGTRFKPGNSEFSWSDAAVYRALLATHRPSKLIEVGSGHSSAQALDTADEFQLDTEFTFIDPFPERLLSTLTPADEDRTTIIRRPVQDVPLDVFEALEQGDVLFIDSTHVSKAGSDVNHLYFSVLPRVPSGVWVHVHDIPWPFEYQPAWFEEGRAWNEVYLLRALLMWSTGLQVEVFSDFLAECHATEFAPFTNDVITDGQGSIWLRRT
jgi:hypothetical protein